MKYNIALVAGDGIGPEVMNAARLVLEKIGGIYGHEFLFDDILAGGCSIDKLGTPLTDEALARCLSSDSVLLGAVGGPRWDDLPGDMRAEKALFTLRKELGVYANIRPATLLPVMKDACPLRADMAEKGFDMVIVRELTGGIYFGDRGRKEDASGKSAYDTECYSEMEIRRICKIGFEMAQKRNKKLTSIDKSNVLESSRFWREIVLNMAKDYPDVELNHLLVDNAAMQLVKNPAQFDVIVTTNMFGDILSDEASQLTGSIGLLPSASLGSGTRGMYEPIHGSAPDIAGRDIANPIAMILSAAMMLEMTFGLSAEADAVKNAVNAVLNKGYRTGDIAAKGQTAIKCSEMTARIIEEIK